MRPFLVAAVSVCLVVPSHGAECTLFNARYKQADAPWWLTFTQVPQFAAPNQTAAFYLELPNSGVTLDGAVHLPNGFGSSLWSISGPCSVEEGAETCAFLDEASHPAIYGIYDGKVQFLSAERGSTAPEQVILPQLAVSLWYSNYRQDEWSGDEFEPGDAFELIGCQ